MTKKREKVTVETIEEWIKHYTNHLSSIEIGKLAGVTSATVRNYLRKAGVSMRPKGRHKKNV